MNGYLNIYKPAGMSSAAVVARIRRLTGEKRVGHAGTLDPEAAGVLPVMTGKATRLFDYLVDKEKEYEAVCAFGRSTDTQDATGQTLETGTAFPSLDMVTEKSKQLLGDISQRPSAFSAIKVGGKPLYARARRGETVQVPERVVHIEAIQVLGEEPDHGVSLRISCGRGTYIRTLCDDLGRLCGCPAHMRSLLRTKSGFFLLVDALTLPEAEQLSENGQLASRLVAPDAPLEHLPKVEADPALEKAVRAGAKLPLQAVSGPALLPGKPARLYLNGQFWGIVTRHEDEHMLIWKAQISPDPEQ